MDRFNLSCHWFYAARRHDVPQVLNLLSSEGAFGKFKEELIVTKDLEGGVQVVQVLQEGLAIN